MNNDEEYTVEVIRCALNFYYQIGVIETDSYHKAKEWIDIAKASHWTMLAPINVMEKALPKPQEMDVFINVVTGLMTPLGRFDSRRNDPFWQQPDGRVISVKDYPELFAIIGTTYGAGDSEGEFRLPDLRARVVDIGGNNE